MKRFAIQKWLFTLLWIEIDYFRPNLFQQGKLGRDVDLKTSTLSSSNLPVIWCKSARWMHNWNSGQKYVWYWDATSVPYVLSWWTYHHDQTISYVTVQTLDPLLENFMSPKFPGSQFFMFLYWMVWKQELYWQTVLKNCVVKTQTFHTLTSLYLTPLVYLQLGFWSRLLVPNRHKVGSFSKNKRQKLQRLYHKGDADCVSACIVVKASTLTLSKVRHFLDSNFS